MSEAMTDQSERRNNKYAIIISRYFSTLLSLINGISRWKISKEIEYLNSTIMQHDLINICRTPLPSTAEYTFI